MNNWIKLHRQFVDWEWFTDVNTAHFFIYLLLAVRWKDGAWRGIPISRGETIKSIYTMSEETGLTVQNIRTAIAHLESTGELTQRQHGKYRIVKVKNYDKYQEDNTENNTMVTQDQHDANTMLTPKEEGKKDTKKEGKNVDSAQSAPTPRQQAKDFFNDTERHQQAAEFFAAEGGVELERVRAEVDKFVSYWTEPTHSGKKQRWETEKTFDIKRRMQNWFRNIDKFNKGKGKPNTYVAS